MSILTEDKKPSIAKDLYSEFAVHNKTLLEVTWEQQRYHELRRWSVTDIYEQIDTENISVRDQVILYNAGRAELTTKPGADRVVMQTLTEGTKWRDKNPTVALIIQAMGTWMRYWNEEEAHHETSLLVLCERLGKMPSIDNDTFLDYRQVFPDDNMMRTMMMLVNSEVVAATNYANTANLVEDKGLKLLFKRLSSDEMQHMHYFISFARALFLTGEFFAKDAFSIAHLFMKEGGELEGSSRDSVEERDGTHVNWWDHLKQEEGMPEVNLFPEVERKRQMIYDALERITDIRVNNREELEDTWMELAATT